MGDRFAGYVCWDHDRLGETAVIDAASPSDAVFLATHHSARIYRRGVGELVGGTQCEENDVLKDLLESKLDPLLVPIIGASGSGKSHLVRWLKASLDVDGTGLHVIYVPKFRTSLRAVIEDITRDFQDDAFRDIERSLRQAASRHNERTAPVALLNRLAEYCENNEVAIDGDGRYRQQIISGANGLAALLLDHGYRRTLLRPSGVIERFVRQVFHGRSEGDSVDPFHFSPEDFDLSGEIVAETEAARRIIGKLAGDAALRVAAAEMMTDFLQPAVQDVIGIGANQLSAIFERLRELLLLQKKELVILIEDFATLQGIQKELLEALLVPSVQQGRMRFCKLRTVMAVTEGHFNTFRDTVRTRCRNIYSLDVNVDAIDSEEVVSFVGRYLNAARLGRVAIENAASSAPHRSQVSWVPNACDRCPVQEKCHSSFGTSSNQHGLYPFNAIALQRAIKARARHVGDRFDPREVIAGVITHVLAWHRGEIQSGDFPSQNFAAQFEDPQALALDSIVDQQIKIEDPSHAARRSVLLTFWGDAPDRLVDLVPAIHEAFQLPMLGVAGNLSEHVEETSHRDVGEAPTTPVAGKQPNPVQPPERNRSIRNAVAAWRRDIPLPQEMRRRLREFIHGVISLELGSDYYLTAVQKRLFDRGGRFTIDSIHFGGVSANDGRIHLIIDPSKPEDVTAVEGALHFLDTGDWRFDHGGAYLRAFGSALQRWTSLIRSHSFLNPGEFENAVESLALGCLVLKYDGVSSNSPGAVLDAILTDVTENATEGVPPEWRELVALAIHGDSRAASRAQLINDVLEYSGVAKGGSGPQVINGPAILAVAHRRLDEMERELGITGDGRCSQHLRQFLRLLPNALTAREKQLTDWLTFVEERIGECPEAPGDIAHVITSAVAEASSITVLQPPTLLQDLRRYAEEFSTLHLGDLIQSVKRAVTELTTVSGTSKLQLLSLPNSNQMNVAKRFLALADHICNELQPQLDRKSQEIGNAVLARDTALEEILNQVNELQRILTSLKKSAAAL